MVSLVTTPIRFVLAVGSSWKEQEFRGVLSLVVVTLPCGTLFYRYGVLSASKAVGKVFTILYIPAGIGIILGFANAVAERSMERRKERRSRR